MHHVTIQHAGPTRNCINCLHNCKDHSLFDFISAVLIYDLFHINLSLSFFDCNSLIFIKVPVTSCYITILFTYNYCKKYESYNWRNCILQCRDGGSKVAGVVRVVQRVTIFVPRGEGDPNRPPWLFCDCFFTLPLGFTQFSIVTKAQSQSATLPSLKNNHFSTTKYQGLTILKSLLKSS